MDKSVLAVLLILGVCTSSISGYPLLFQQGGLANNGINFLSAYQNLLLQQQQQQQTQDTLLRLLSSNVQPLYYSGVPNNFAAQNVVRDITDTVGTVTGSPTTSTPTSTPTSTTTLLTGDGLPVDTPTPGLPVLDPTGTSPIPGVSPCAAAGVLGNAALSGLCCSLIGALSPCSLLGLGGLTGLGGLAGVGGLGAIGGLAGAGGLAGVGGLPLASLLLANSVPGIGNLGGLGGCACNGLSLPQLPNPLCCGTNVVVLPVPVSGIADSSPVPIPPTPITDGGGTSPVPIPPLLKSLKHFGSTKPVSTNHVQPQKSSENKV